MTGRDSVLAQHRDNSQDTAGSVEVVSQEERDSDLVRRIHVQMAEAGGRSDLSVLRSRCQEKDKHKAGKLSRDEVSSSRNDTGLYLLATCL